MSIYALYSVSEKVDVHKRTVASYLNQRKILALLLAGSTFLSSVLVTIMKMSLAVGIIFSLVLWMALACLIIIGMPFEKIKWKHLTLLALLTFAIEYAL